MKIKLFVSISLIGLLTSGCSSSPKIVDQPKIEEKRDYKVKNRNYQELPNWALDQAGYLASIPQNERQWIGEQDEVVNKGASCNMAKLQAKNKVAEEVASMISSEMSTNTSSANIGYDKNSGDTGKSNTAYKSEIMQKATAILSDVQIVGEAWEERDYSQKGGPKSVYSCWVLAKMDKQKFEDTVAKVKLQLDAKSKK